MRREEIVNALRLPKNERKQLHELIEELLENGEVARLKKDRLCIPSDADLVSGRIVFRQSGAATLIADATPKAPIAEGYPVRAEDTWVALHGDKVLARVMPEEGPKRPAKGKKQSKPSADPDEKPPVRVIRILKRARDTLPGTLEFGRHYAYVIPDDPRIIHDILVPDPKNAGIRPRPRKGDKVLVKLVEWKQRHLNPAGDLVEVLGKTHQPDAEFKALLYKYQLDAEFPANVMKEAENIPDTVDAAHIEGRQDVRDVFTFTIDPDDAKDFDDALSIEPAGDKRWRIGIHIADVSAYVKPGGALDTEAQRRGNSTYLVGTVIPMLPHALSNGLCSLVEGEDRLTKSVFITYSESAEVVDVAFANTVIRSDKRLTYRQARAFLKEDDFAAIRSTPLPPGHQTGATGRSLEEVGDAEIKRLREDIRQLWSIAAKARKKRFRKGALDLDMTDVKIYVDEDGYADRIEKQVHDESHQLIEEFMLAANEAVGAVMRRNDYPCIYRVHDEPEEDKLEELRETMITFGVQCGNLSKPREMSALLEKLKTHPQGYSLKLHVLRSLKQAQYRAEPDGHYGLAKRDYTHFTSPIRRYSDLIVHRVLHNYMHKFGAPSAEANPDIRYKQEKLVSMADHLCVTERNSVDAERDSIKEKLLEFFERELSREQPRAFRAVIVDVRNHGMFVELTDSLAYGLVHVSTLADDLYILNSDGTALVGRRKKRAFHLGDSVMVEVERVDRFKRQIDFRVSAAQVEGEPDPASVLRAPEEDERGDGPPPAAGRGRPKRGRRQSRAKKPAQKNAKSDGGGKKQGAKRSAPHDAGGPRPKKKGRKKAGKKAAAPNDQRSAAENRPSGSESGRSRKRGGRGRKRR